MKISRQMLFGPCALLILSMFASAGSAADVMRDRRTVMTFDSPLQVPGMVLPGGTYVFKLYEPLSNRNIVQIWNREQTKVLVTAPAIPVSRPENQARSDKTVFTFEERPGGAPHALRAWFYPGDDDGRQFVYPPSHVTEVATNSMVSTTSSDQPAIVADSTMASASSTVPEKAEPIEEASSTYTAPPETMSQPQSTDQTTAPAATQNTTAKELPKTASSTPLVALMGMLSLVAAFGLWLVSKQR